MTEKKQGSSRPALSARELALGAEGAFAISILYTLSAARLDIPAWLAALGLIVAIAPAVIDGIAHLRHRGHGSWWKGTAIMRWQQRALLVPFAVYATLVLAGIGVDLAVYYGCFLVAVASWPVGVWASRRKRFAGNEQEQAG